jgi:hypothetical protein
MMGDLQIPLPPEMEPFRADLTFFMSAMVRKLHINRHKGFIDGKSTYFLLNGVHEEVKELDSALDSESQFEAALEAVDVANQAFLVAAKVWQMTKSEYEKERRHDDP